MAGDIGEALKRIEEAKRRGSRVLSLGGLGLTELPRQLFGLIDLKELDLTRNRLAELPADIGQLRALQVLYLVDNHLAAMPAEIGRSRLCNGLMPETIVSPRCRKRSDDCVAYKD